jgi:hypothetical protein
MEYLEFGLIALCFLALLYGAIGGYERLAEWLATRFFIGSD